MPRLGQLVTRLVTYSLVILTYIDRLGNNSHTWMNITKDSKRHKAMYSVLVSQSSREWFPF